MKCFAALCLVGVALGAPAPEDAAAPVVLPYGYGLGAYPYALPYAVYDPLHTGLVYPVAEPYVHDVTGDVSDDSSPEAPAYVHDTTGDARKKRDADAQVLYGAYPYAYGYAGLPYVLPIAPLVAHPNGAVVPLEPKDVVDARAEHLAAVAEALSARKKRDADPQLLYGAYPYALGAYGYAGLPYALPIAPLVAHPNGAVVPLEPKDVVDARAEHLAAVAEALSARKKRDADAQVLYGAYPYAYGYAGLPYALPIAPFVAHPNGAVVPLEPKDVVDARTEHLAAVAEAIAS